MRDFHCPNCGQRLTFENSTCLACGSALGFSLPEMALLVIAKGGESDQAGFVDADDYQLCGNRNLAKCNWLIRVDNPGGLCTSCALTVERPNDADTAGLAEFARAEAAKRRLIAELYELKLPIVGHDEDPEHGLAFRLLSSAHEKVMTGHENGVITIDLAEGNDVHREQLRIIRAAHFQQRLAALHELPGHHEDAAHRSAHLGDHRCRRERVVGHRACESQLARHFPGRDRHHLHVRHLILWNRE